MVVEHLKQKLIINNMRTAIDIVLEGVSDGQITVDDAKIILEELNKPPQIVTVPYNTGTTTTTPNKKRKISKWSE